MCKKDTGMVLSLILALKLVFSAIKQENVQMLLDSHIFLFFKDNRIFLLKRDILMCHFPTVPAHLFLLIILNFSKCEHTHIKKKMRSFYGSMIACLGRVKANTFLRTWYLDVPLFSLGN